MTLIRIYQNFKKEKVAAAVFVTRLITKYLHPRANGPNKIIIISTTKHKISNSITGWFTCIISIIQSNDNQIRMMLVYPKYQV